MEDLPELCHYTICKHMDLKTQVNISMCSSYWHQYMKEAIWRPRFKKCDTDEFVNLENDQLLWIMQSIANYIEEINIVSYPTVQNIYRGYLGRQSPNWNLEFFLLYPMPNLKKIKIYDYRLHDGHMLLIKEKIPHLQMLCLKCATISGNHIGDMENLHELELFNCKNVEMEHFANILKLNLNILKMPGSLMDFGNEVLVQALDQGFGNNLLEMILDTIYFLRRPRILKKLLFLPKLQKIKLNNRTFEKLTRIFSSMQKELLYFTGPDAMERNMYGMSILARSDDCRDYGRFCITAKPMKALKILVTTQNQAFTRIHIYPPLDVKVILSILREANEHAAAIATGTGIEKLKYPLNLYVPDNFKRNEMAAVRERINKFSNLNVELDCTDFHEYFDLFMHINFEIYKD